MPRTSATIKLVAIAACAVIGFITQVGAHSQALPQSQSQSPPILVIATAPSTQKELAEVVDTLNKWTAKCQMFKYLDHPITLRAFIGGEVTAIRIVRFSRWSSAQTSARLEQTLRSVWEGKFQSVSCHIDWDEGTFWSIEAEVEFADGSHRELFTDGNHVAFQDYNGKSWFVRLLPSAQ